MKRIALLAVVATVGCDKLDIGLEPPKEPPFEFAVHVTSDPGKHLAGAEVSVEEKVVGATDAQGALRMKFSGKEGEALDVVVKCPKGFESPTQATSVTLRRLAAGSRVPTYEVRCPPSLRTVVVGVRTDNGPNLPVMYLGREVAKTDAHGAAHFLLSVKPAEQVEVTLSTAEKAAEPLRPQNPTLTFLTKTHDDFVVLEQKFTVERKFVPVKKKETQSKPMPL